MSKYFRQVILILLCLVTGAAIPKESTFFIITMTGPGTQSDQAARYFAPLLEAHLGQPVVVMNVPGGDGAVAMRQYKEQGESCDSLLLGNASILYAALNREKFEYDPLDQFIPVHGMANAPSILLAPATSDIRNVDDLVKTYNKAGRLVGGSFTPQTATSMEMLDKSMGTKSTMVHYKTAAQMAIDLAAGRLDYTITVSGSASTQGLIDAGRLRVIAIVGDRRLSYYPGVPTVKEQGYTSPETFYWSAFFVNRSAKGACRKYLERVVDMTLNSELGDHYAQQPGGPTRFMANGEQVRAFMRAQLKVLQEFKSK